MEGKKENAALNVYLGEHSGPVSLEMLRDFFRKREPGIPDATVNWRLHDLVNSGVLRRVGRGLYAYGTAMEFRPELSSRVTKVSKYLKKGFPLINFCVWSTELLNEFAQHVSSHHFILVDVDKDVMESVYYNLLGEFSGVFLRPPATIMDDLLPQFRLPLIVRQLISESPLNETSNLPLISLEKLLVDAFCDAEFRFLEGSELRAVFRNAFEKYTINENKLLRYAARKGRKAEISAYLYQGNFRQSTFKPIS